MLQAYVGIVSRRGIELFCPEHPQTVRFLWRRIQREQGRVAGFWSVIHNDAADCVVAALEQGRLRDALIVMQQHAQDFGSLVPCEHHQESEPGNRDHG